MPETIEKNVRPPNSLLYMTEPPKDPLERERIGDGLWCSLVFEFERTLTPGDVEIFRSAPPTVVKKRNPEHLRVLNQFDDFVLRHLRIYGWRMLMSRSVLQRLAEFEKHSPRLSRRVGEELETKSKEFRGETKAILPDNFHEFVPNVIVELKMLFERKQEKFAKQRSEPTRKQIAGWMHDTIIEQGAGFRILIKNLSMLCSFVENDQFWKGAAGPRLQNGALSATDFCYLWLAATTGRTILSLRREVSRSRRHK